MGKDGSPTLSADDLRRLREDLRGAGYTVDGVLDLLGPAAYAALGRAETVPALRATTGGSPLETLTRLFVLQTPVARAQATQAVGEPVFGSLLASGTLTVDDDVDGRPAVRATVDIRPYAAEDADLYVVSDLGTGIGGVTGPVRPEHVLGVGGASTTLAQITVRPPLGRALDLGTGCGVQALHLALHSDHVVATDRNPRALRFAGMSAALSGVDLDLREGNLFEPVAGERFDLVVSNPPFVMSPVPRYLYRDSGHLADDLCRTLVGQAPDHLAPGGFCQVLASWLHVRDEDWRERVAGWVVPTGCDALVLQREVLDPMEYAELWLRDCGEAGAPGYPDLYEAWLDSFDTQGVEAIGPAILDWFARLDQLRGVDDTALLASALTVAGDVRLEQESAPAVGPPPDTGWRPVAARLRQLGGLRRSGAVDPVGADVVAGCDGFRPLGEVLERVAAAHGAASADLLPGAVSAVRTLVEEGFLLVSPAGVDPKGPTQVR